MNYYSVLIIDDDILTMNAVSKRLSKRGYKVDSLSSGDNILIRLENKSYDLILLDIKMPHISGLDILKLIRTKYKKNLLPIIMFSSNDSDRDVINALKLGANDYIKKPVNFEILLSRVKTHLEVRYLSLDYARQEQLKAITEMITNYNHEINNSLTISIGLLNKIKRESYLPPEIHDKFCDTQDRVDIVIKKINDIIQGNQLKFVTYSEHLGMVDSDRVEIEKNY